MSLYTDSSGSVPHSNDTVESVEIKTTTTTTSNAPHRRIVDEYEIGKSLGKGHFGQVKLAHRFTTGEMCALKIIEHKANFSPRQQELFQREIEALSTIHHKNVISLRRVIPNINFPHEKDGRNRSVLLLDLELCSGGELFDYILSNGPFPECVARHCFREMMNGLLACHNHGIFHRDLKPENIFISTSPSLTNPNMLEYVLKIGDFGLASINGNSDNVLCKTPVGTRSYQAPEVIASNGQPYDGGKADIWSAGVIFFILLVGNPPFVVADRSDWWFNAVRLVRHKDFWKAHQRPPCTKVNENAMLFLNKIFNVNPTTRISLNEIMNDEYLNNMNEIKNDEHMSQLFFNQLSSSSKQTRENNLNEAKQIVQNQALTSEVVFAQNVERCTIITPSSETTELITNEPNSTSMSSSSSLSSNTPKPPSMLLKDLTSSFEHVYHCGVRNNENILKKSFQLFTSTSPELLYQWIAETFQQNKQTSSSSSSSRTRFNENKFHISMEVDTKQQHEEIIMSLNNEMNETGVGEVVSHHHPHPSFSSGLNVEIQIWSIEDEVGISMIECYLKKQSPLEDEEDDQSQVESMLSLSKLHELSNFLSEFWYNDILLVLKTRGCIEAQTYYDEYNNNNLNKIEDGEEEKGGGDDDNKSEDEKFLQSILLERQRHKSMLPCLFQLQPPPNIIFSEDGGDDKEERQGGGSNEVVVNVQEETSVLTNDGHDDIF